MMWVGGAHDDGHPSAPRAPVLMSCRDGREFKLSWKQPSSIELDNLLHPCREVFFASPLMMDRNCSLLSNSSFWQHAEFGSLEKTDTSVLLVVPVSRFLGLEFNFLNVQPRNRISSVTTSGAFWASSLKATHLLLEFK